MSTLMLIQTSPGIISAAAGGGGGGGILDWINDKGADLENTLIIVGAVVALFFLIKSVFSSGFTITAVVMAGLVAALFIWFLNNIMTVSDRVGNEFNSAPTSEVSSATLHT